MWIAKKVGIEKRLALGLLLSGCGGDADTTSVQEPSSWLGPCTSDAGCGVGQCLCGVCTLSCATEGCGAGPAGSECIGTEHFTHAGLCAGRVSEPICLSVCSAEAGCGAEQACVEGVCLPAATAAIARAVREGSADTLCGANPVVSRSLAIDNQAQLDALAGCERIDGDLTLWLFPRVNTLPLAALREITGVLTVRGDPNADPEPLPAFTALELAGALHLTGLRLDGPPPLPRLTTLRAGSEFDLNRGGLSIGSCSGLLDLSAFGAIEELRYLAMSDSPEPTTLEGLSALRRLQRLTLFDTGVTDLSRLEQVSGLRQIDLSGNSRLESLAGLGDGRELRRLLIVGNDRLASLRGLAVPAALSELVISANERLATLTGLEELRRVDALELRSLPALTSLTGLDGVERAVRFVLDDNARIESLAGLGALREIESLYLTNNPGLVTLVGLGRLEVVGFFMLGGAPALQSLAGLGTPSLEALQVNITALTDLTGIEGVTGLRDISLSENDQLASLNGLPGLEATASVYITGSPRLVDLGRLREATTLSSLNLTAVGLPNLDALENLRELTSLSLSANSELLHIDALSDVRGLYSLIVTDNPLLVRLPEFAGVVHIESLSSFDADISRNPSLSEGPSFPALEQASDITVVGNATLPRLTGFAAVRELLSLRVENNAALNELHFSALQSADALIVRGHPLLTDDQLTSLIQVPARIEKLVSGTGRDPCPWLEDQMCDEEFADCAPGSDVIDCTNLPIVIPSENP